MFDRPMFGVGLKLPLGLGLLAYGLFGHHGLMLILGVALVGWGVLSAMRRVRAGARASSQSDDRR